MRNNSGQGGTAAASRRPAAYRAMAALMAVTALLAACGGGGNSGSRKSLSSAASRNLQTVPIHVLTSAAATVTSLNPATPLAAAALTAEGKPQVLYLGGEFCPYCAAERWPLVVALSKFGTFRGLSQTTTGPDEGNMPTLSFYGSSYTSRYLAFTPVELYGNEREGQSFKALETPTTAQRELWSSTLQGHLTFPFVDLGGRYLLKTSQFSPTLLKGQSVDAVARSVGDNTTTVGANIDAAASGLVGYICNLTGNQPAATCSGPGGAG